MTELLKEKEIFICNKCLELFNAKDKKNSLKTISDYLETEEDIIMIFCEIIGNRWKFITGSKNFMSPMHEYKEGTLGIMIQDWGKLKMTNKKIINCLFNIYK